MSMSNNVAPMAIQLAENAKPTSFSYIRTGLPTLACSSHANGSVLMHDMCLSPKIRNPTFLSSRLLTALHTSSPKYLIGPLLLFLCILYPETYEAPFWAPSTAHAMPTVYTQENISLVRLYMSSPQRTLSFQNKVHALSSRSTVHSDSFPFTIDQRTAIRKKPPRCGNADG